MNNTIRYISVFVVGAVTGSAIAWKVFKNKYEKMYQDEISEVKNMFYEMKDKEDSDSHPTIDVDKTFKTVVVHRTDSANYEVKNQSDEDEESLRIRRQALSQNQEIINKYNYASCSEEKKEGEPMKNKPYVISPEEFDESGEYEPVSLTYYADGVLADSITDERIENPEEIVGEFESHFGEYEDDSVFVRNDKLLTDYEILRDTRNFSDVVEDSGSD